MPARAIKKINENNLIKIMNLLDSPIEGEFLATAKSAACYLKSHGALWNEVVHEASPPYPSERQAPGFIGLRDSVILKRTSRASRCRETDKWLVRKSLVPLLHSQGKGRKNLRCAVDFPTEGKRTARRRNLPAHSGGC